MVIIDEPYWTLFFNHSDFILFLGVVKTKLIPAYRNHA